MIIPFGVCEHALNSKSGKPDFWNSTLALVPILIIMHFAICIGGFWFRQFVPVETPFHVPSKSRRQKPVVTTSMLARVRSRCVSQTLQALTCLRNVIQLFGP